MCQRQRPREGDGKLDEDREKRAVGTRFRPKAAYDTAVVRGSVRVAWMAGDGDWWRRRTLDGAGGSCRERTPYHYIRQGIWRRRLSTA